MRRRRGCGVGRPTGAIAIAVGAIAIAVGAIAIAVGAVACAGPRFEVGDLPASPIAFVYRTVEESDRVLDLFEQNEEARRRAQLGAGGDGRFDVGGEEVERLLGLRGEWEQLRDALGRLSFYDAPARRLEVADFAARGARPLEWSADHGRLLFAALLDKRHALYEWDRERREVRPVVDGRWSYSDGSYGPDGAIAYVEVATPKGQAATARIWVRRPGEAPRAITEGPVDTAPAWSPRASRIVYVARRGGRDWLHWVDPTTGEGGALTPGRAPVFTPDGAWIVYSAKSRGTWKLWRMHADGSGRFRFGDSAFHENDPSVSPDGAYVVYAGTKQEQSAASRLFVRPLDGSPDRHLDFSGSGLIPVW